MLNGAEWEFNEQQERKLLANEMDSWRKSARISRKNERIKEMKKKIKKLIQFDKRKIVDMAALKECL